MPEIELSKKYRPLFEIDRAQEILQKKKLTKAQRKHYKDLEKVHTCIITGGRYSAKSFAVGLAACDWTAATAHKILYTRYTLTSAHDSIIPEFSEKISILDMDEHFQAYKDRFKVHHNDGEIVFKGIKTSTGNQTANLKSIKGFSRWILDEAEEMPSFKEFGKIKLSIRSIDKKNLTVMILNPATMQHWIFIEYFLKKNVDPGFNGIKNNILYIHTSYQDVARHHIPDEIWNEYEEARRVSEKFAKLTPDEKEQSDIQTRSVASWFDHVVMGGWIKQADGCVFEYWEQQKFPDDMPFTWGMDYGFSPDPTALVKVGLDLKNKIVYLKEYCYNTGLSIDNISSILNTHTKTDDLIVAESADKRLNMELRELGHNIIPTIKGPGSIKDGLKLMSGFRIVVDPDSHNLKNELNNYIWTSKRAGVPVDKYNHLIDAARYNLSRQLVVGEL